eukprot:TRINITY_DN2101_c0_g1_i1.p2 TRINITY_DN2101_c0_g1~~TRINITY_DN2101_c0_g1_i1.p2  ORF type:complete len:472 (-),score=72.62 TRINITY_DN2101_c0_g1_i1:84-1499(-)
MTTSSGLSTKFILATCVFQLGLVVLIAIFCTFETNEPGFKMPTEVRDDHYLGWVYAMFQDVHVMMFIGFGFLLSFLGRHQLSSIAGNFLIGALGFQWALLTLGFFHQIKPEGMKMGDWHKIELDVHNLVTADYAIAAMMISYSGILGKCSHLQWLVMVFFEAMWYSFNEWVGYKAFGAIDIGGSMYIHTFGCYFGLAVAWLNPFTAKSSHKEIHNKYLTSTYYSDTTAMIGTIFLWAFWPSFNAALGEAGGHQHRTVINTVIALCCSCSVTYFWSLLLRGHFNMVDIQNASISGGVAVGCVADLMIEPYGAMLIGLMSGTISTVGYVKLTPILTKKIGLNDTAGINNLHGMPGILGALAGIFAALNAKPEVYGDRLGHYYPKMAPSNVTVAESLGLTPGEDRPTYIQAGYQAAALFVTIGLAILGGLTTGLVMKYTDGLTEKEYYNDKAMFKLNYPTYQKSEEEEHAHDDE